MTRNPWNPRLTPGGSSGGSVAGCAAGLFPLALATDGGGSIRRPASHTGLVGFKPSRGRVARADGLPQILLDYEVVGPVARSVEDAKLFLDAIRGPDARDRSSLPVSRTARVAMPATILAVAAFPGAPVDREITSSFDAALATFARLGHRIEAAPLPLSLDAIDAFWPLVGQVGLARAFDADPALRAGASPKYVDMAEQGARASAAQFLAGLDAVAAFRREAAALFERVDFVLTPTTAALPWPAEEPFPPRSTDAASGRAATRCSPAGSTCAAIRRSVCRRRRHAKACRSASRSSARSPTMTGALALAREYERAAARRCCRCARTSLRRCRRPGIPPRPRRPAARESFRPRCRP